MIGVLFLLFAVVCLIILSGAYLIVAFKKKGMIIMLAALALPVLTLVWALLQDTSGAYHPAQVIGPFITVVFIFVLVAVVLSFGTVLYAFIHRRRLKKSARSSGSTGGLQSAKSIHHLPLLTIGLVITMGIFAAIFGYFEDRLDKALTHGDVSYVRKVITNKNEANQELFNDYQYPLHQAAHYGRGVVVAYLLEKGALVNRRNSKGDTSLDAVFDGNWTRMGPEYEPVILLLLLYGVNISKNNMEEIFDYEHHKNILEFLKKAIIRPERISQPNDELKYFMTNAIRSDSRDIIEYFIQKGNEQALFYLGELYAEKDRDKLNAIYYWQQAADKGHSEAQLRLDALYADGQNQRSGVALALELRKKAEATGDAHAQFKLGRIFQEGTGIPRDAVLAQIWYEKSAEQGHVEAQYMLGKIYYEDEYHSHSRLAIDWLEKAALQGHIDAPFMLGLLYDKAYARADDPEDADDYYRKVQDYEKAIHWYETAVKRGNANARGHLATIFKKSKDVPSDPMKMARYYLREAQKDNVEAQYILAVMYARGIGVPEDQKKAAHWYEQAAMQGCIAAQYNTGLRYAEGKGLPVNIISACAWLYNADTQAHLSAGDEFESLCRTLPWEEQNEFRRRASELIDDSVTYPDQEESEE